MVIGRQIDRPVFPVPLAPLSSVTVAWILAFLTTLLGMALRPIHAIRLMGLALPVALLSTACDPPLGAPLVPDEVAIPATIGLIAESEQRDDGRLVTLEDGTPVLLPNGGTDLTGPAADGRLLVVGEGQPPAPDGGVWYAAVPSRPSGCFYLDANGEVRGDQMALSLGFSLALSDAWSETETTFVQSPVVGFCLDRTGAVVGTYSNSRR